MYKNERKDKAVAYIDKAIERVDLHIEDCQHSLNLRDFPPYVLSRKIYKEGMEESNFERAAKEAGYGWDEDDCLAYFYRLLRWDANLKKTETILASYKSIRSAYEETKQEVINYKGWDEESFYSDLLGMAQIGLTSEELAEFQDATDSMEVELGKNKNGKPYTANLRGATLISGIGGSGKTVLLKNILHSLLKSNNPDKFRLVLVDTDSGHEMEEFAQDPHLYHGTIIEDADTFKKFLRDDLPEEIQIRKGLRDENKYDDMPILLIAFNNFDAVADSLGVEKAKELIQFLAWKGMANKIFSLIVSLHAYPNIFQGSMHQRRMNNVIAMECDSETSSEFLIGTKDAMKICKPGETIIRDRDGVISEIIHVEKKVVNP
jgi:hypothetical protein